jgi:hypothetical protein
MIVTSRGGGDEHDAVGVNPVIADRLDQIGQIFRHQVWPRARRHYWRHAVKQAGRSTRWSRCDGFGAMHCAAVNLTLSLAFLAPQLVKALLKGAYRVASISSACAIPPAEWSIQFKDLGLDPL